MSGAAVATADTASSPKMTIFEEIIVGDYVCNKLIGSGSFSDIYLGVGVNSSVYPVNIALKKIYLDRLGSHKDKIFKEIGIMQKMTHKNVLKIIKYIIKDNIAYLILEYCNYGDMTRLWVTDTDRNDGLSLDVTKSVFKQVIDGFVYLKGIDSSIIHRDIKLENILLHKKKNGRIVAKIADFGFCLFGQSEAINMTICGSPMYMAPELFLSNRVYDDKIDIWSMGIILYKMHYGYNKHPFGNIHSISDIVRAFQAMKKDNDVIHIPPVCNKCTSECLISSLIRRMLTLSSASRITWHEIHALINDWGVDAMSSPPTVHARGMSSPINIPSGISRTSSVVQDRVVDDFYDTGSVECTFTPMRQSNVNSSILDFMYRIVYGYK